MGVGVGAVAGVGGGGVGGREGVGGGGVGSREGCGCGVVDRGGCCGGGGDLGGEGGVDGGGCGGGGSAGGDAGGSGDGGIGVGQNDRRLARRDRCFVHRGGGPAMSDENEDANWFEDYGLVVEFGRRLYRLMDAKGLQNYYEKPWLWTEERNEWLLESLREELSKQ